MQHKPARTLLGLCLVAGLSLCFVTSAFGAIGVYPRSNPGLVPATISYVLNKNADNLAGETPDWSLKIEIVPAAGGAAVRTWRFLPSDTLAQKGIHNNAVVWDGMKDDGTPAPSGRYKAKITARANPVTNDTNLHLLWMDSPTNLYMPGINRNVNSPLFGRIYVTQKTNGLRVYEPDGTYLGTWNGGVSWGTASGPYTAAVDENDNIWMSARSGNQPRTFWCIKSDLSGTIYGPISFGTYDRGGDVYGPTNSIKILDSACATTGTLNGVLQWTSGNGGAPASPMQSWTCPGTGEADALAFQPAKLYYDSTAAKVRALVPYRFVNTNAAGTGGVVCYDIDWAGTNAPTKIWRNDTLTMALSVDIAPDGNTLWVTRNVVTDGQEVGKISMANAAAGQGFEQLYGLAGTGVPTQLEYMKLDSFGNMISTGGGFTEAFEPNVGMYEPPESAPSVAAVTVPCVDPLGIRWDGDDSPTFVSGSFSDDTVCAGQSTTLTVTVSDNDNDCATNKNDIGSVKVTCPELGWNAASMGYVSCSGKQRTYSLVGTVQPGAAADGKTVSIEIFDATPGVTPGTGSVSFEIIGGLITGVLTNGETGAPAANVTMKATLGTATYTALTDANGRYTINVDPGTGYSVAPATAGPYGVTTPTEYNLTSAWTFANQTGGTNDWPKTVDVTACGTTADLNGRVWPLACTQVFYDWVSSTHVFMPGARTVSVIGTVLRQPEIASTSQKGFNGYYWITDSRYSGTYIACKIAWRTGDPVVKKGDKVVVTGLYDVPYAYRMGRVIPDSAASVVVLSHNNTLPSPRDLSYYQNNGATACGGSAIIGNLLGGLYRIPDTTVTAVDTVNQRYTVQVPKCVTDATPQNITIDLDTPASTGCPLPNVGDELMITGVLDDIAMWATTGAIRPGEPGDQAVIPLVHSVGEACALGQSGVRMDLSAAPAIVTSSEPAPGGGQTWFYIESPDRSSGLRVNCSAFPPANYVEPGDTVTWLKGNLQNTSADFQLLLNQAATITNNHNPDGVPKPIGMTNLSAGTGYAPATDRGFGVRSQGLYATLWGRVTRVEQVDWVLAIVWIDDGTTSQSAMVIPGTPTVYDPAVGVKCYVGDPSSQPWELSVGDYVVVSGIIGSEWINDPAGGYRIRVLRTRPQNLNTGAGGDLFRVIQDVP